MGVKVIFKIAYSNLKFLNLVIDKLNWKALIVNGVSTYSGKLSIEYNK